MFDTNKVIRKILNDDKGKNNKKPESLDEWEKYFKEEEEKHKQKMNKTYDKYREKNE